jgi:folate-dependent tRNA-U54 methylase TrmFO/GidA
MSRFGVMAHLKKPIMRKKRKKKKAASRKLQAASDMKQTQLKSRIKT